MTINKLPLTISELHAGLKNKTFSVVDLVDSYLERINKYDKNLNAVLTVTEEYSYKQAKQAEEIITNNPNAFEEFPLLGVVVGLKDMYLTKGIRTTAASKLLESYIPQYSSTAVERLEKAGAIVIGKLNQDAWAHGASGENSDFGSTKNPWNTDYVPGGSSSGSAVAVSAQFSLASMGTDTGGSIRQPASFNNVVGLKPTYGSVPRYGVIAMASSLDSMGHFTHTVEDSETIFNVTKGPSETDATSQKVSLEKAAKNEFTIGIPKEYFVEGTDPEVVSLMKQAIDTLEKQGIKFKEISLPHTKYAVSVYYIIMSAEVSSNLGRYDGVRFGNKRDSFGDEAKRRIMLGSYVLSSGYYDAYYLKAMKVRTKLREDFDKVFSAESNGVDAIFAPVSPTPAFKLGEKVSDPLQMYLADIFTVAASLAGIPSISIPAGFTKDNLPVGFQLMGNHFSEKTLFEIGKIYQKSTDWHTKLPEIK